jgi:hypothetical protein
VSRHGSERHDGQDHIPPSKRSLIRYDERGDRDGGRGGWPLLPMRQRGQLYDNDSRSRHRGIDPSRQTNLGMNTIYIVEMFS